MKPYMSDVPHDRFTQLRQCRRDIEFEIPTAAVTVDRFHIVLRLTYEDATALARLLAERAS